MNSHLRVVASNGAASRGYTYDKWIDDLRGIVWNAYGKGRMTLEEIAVKANLSEKTVENFAWCTTKRPQGRTLFQLAAAVDFRLSFLPASAARQPDEPDLSEFHSLIRKKA